MKRPTRRLVMVLVAIVIAIGAFLGISVGAGASQGGCRPPDCNVWYWPSHGAPPSYEQ